MVSGNLEKISQSWVIRLHLVLPEQVWEERHICEENNIMHTAGQMRPMPILILADNDTRNITRQFPWKVPIGAQMGESKRDLPNEQREIKIVLWNVRHSRPRFCIHGNCRATFRVHAKKAHSCVHTHVHTPTIDRKILAATQKDSGAVVSITTCSAVPTFLMISWVTPMCDNIPIQLQKNTSIGIACTEVGELINWMNGFGVLRLSEIFRWFKSGCTFRERERDRRTDRQRDRQTQ